MSVARSLPRVLLEGLSVLWDELRFAAGTAARRLEIRQVENRRAEEYSRVGSADHEIVDSDLSRIEAAFLAEEAVRLRRGLTEREKRRAADKAARRNTQGEGPGAGL